MKFRSFWKGMVLSCCSYTAWQQKDGFQRLWILRNHQSELQPSGMRIGWLNTKYYSLDQFKIRNCRSLLSSAQGNSTWLHRFSSFTEYKYSAIGPHDTNELFHIIRQMQLCGVLMRRLNLDDICHRHVIWGNWGVWHNGERLTEKKICFKVELKQIICTLRVWSYLLRWLVGRLWNNKYDAFPRSQTG